MRSCDAARWPSPSARHAQVPVFRIPCSRSIRVTSCAACPSAWRRRRRTSRAGARRSAAPCGADFPGALVVSGNEQKPNRCRHRLAPRRAAGLRLPFAAHVSRQPLARASVRWDDRSARAELIRRLRFPHGVSVGDAFRWYLHAVAAISRADGIRRGWLRRGCRSARAKASAAPRRMSAPRFRFTPSGIPRRRCSRRPASRRLSRATSSVTRVRRFPGLHPRRRRGQARGRG